MDGAMREFADALERVARAECSAPAGRRRAPCEDPICRVAALEDALARGAWADLPPLFTPDVEVEYFGVRLPGFARLARGADAAVELLRANEASMRRSVMQLESAKALGDTLVLFHRESGSWSHEGVGHAAIVVTHFLSRGGRIARIRSRAFPVEDPAPSP
jgi:ketosteroid isomerase-like protein